MSSGVTNGQYANEQTFNDAFMARNGDTDTSGKVGLLNIAPESGPQISNAQGFINKIADTVGTSENDPDAKNYDSNNYIADGDSRKTAIEKLDEAAQFIQDQVTIHESRLDDLETATMNIDGDKTFTGNTTFGGQSTFNSDVTINGNVTINGTTTSVNTVDLEVSDRNITVNKGGDNVTANGSGLTVERTDDDGSLVYDESLASKWKAGDVGTESEILTAGTTQTVTGLKQFSALSVEDQIQFTVTDDSASTGTDAVVPTPTPIIKLTNTSLESVAEFGDFYDGKIVIVSNRTGDKIIFKNNVGTNKILTGTGNDLFVEKDATVWISADGASNSWLVVGGTGGGGLFFQEKPSGSTNGVNPAFGPLTYQPVNDEAVLVMVDGLIVPKTGYSIGSGVVTFNAGFIPATGQDVYVYYAHSGISVLPTFAGIQKVEYRTITPAEAAAKQITLAGLPATSNAVVLDVIGGGPAFYGDDFVVAGTALSWTGLGLDGLIDSGDKFRLVYLT